MSFRTLPFVFLYGDQEPRSWGGVQTPPPPQQAVGNPEAQQGAGYIAIIVQLILYYYTTLSAVLQLARLKETFKTTVCVFYRKPFSLLELGYLIIINLLRSVDHM